MATTQNTYTGNGSTVLYSFTFPYLETTDIKVSLNGTVTTAYTLANATTIQFTTAPANGAAIRIYRQTDDSNLQSTFYPGSAIRSSDLNDNFTQNLYVTQEANNNVVTSNTTANTALSTANTALSNSTAAVATSNTASANASAAVATSNTASSNASAAVATANTASSTASTAVATANMALDEADFAADLALDTAISQAALDANVYDKTELDAGQLDNRYYTETELNSGALDSQYFRQDSSETINSGMAWSGSDSYIATTKAIDARIVDLVDDVGGFVPIANENSFPASNPDINNPDGSGTIVSIKEISSTRTPSSGTVTIANGSSSNTVTINGCGSTVLAAGFGVLVETTSTLHTYTFHRLVPKATEVTTVASISGDVTAVAANSTNVTTVATNASSINSVAGNATNINAVNANSANINAVAGNALNINAVSTNSVNINSVASNSANVNTVAGSIADVNTVASSIGSVNSFSNVYRIASSDPTTSLDIGDLVFNTTNKELRIYNGTAWQAGVTATGNLVSKSGDTMTGPLLIAPGTAALPGLSVSGDPNTGLYSPGADQLAISTNGTGRLFVASDGKVGIGTSSPGETLSIKGAANLYASLTTNGGVKTQIAAVDANSTGSIATVTNHPLLFNTNNTERMRLDSSGRLGLGTSVPLTPLAVTGGITGGNTATTNAEIAFPSAQANSYLRLVGNYQVGAGRGGTIQLGGKSFSDSGTVGAFLISAESADNATNALTFSTQTAFNNSIVERMRLTGTGLGIGNTVPGSYNAVDANDLVVGTNSGNNGITIVGGSTGYSSLAFADSAGTGGNGDYAGLIQYGHSADSMNFFTGALERARIDSSGRLGLGNNNPKSKLDVTLAGVANLATSTITSVSSFGANGSFGFAGLANNLDGVYFGMGAGGGNGIPAGIGFFRETSGWNTALAFYTNNLTGGPDSTNAIQEKMRITSAGFVGIGTTSPGTNLNVVASGAGGKGGEIIISNSSARQSGNYAQLGFAPNNDYGGIVICGFIRGLDTGGSAGNPAALTFGVGSGGSPTERMRLDDSGRLLVGTSTAVTGANASISKLSVIGNSSNSAGNAVAVIGRGAAASTLSAGNDVGAIFFTDNGSNEFAAISCQADAATGAADAPGRLVFSTTPDNSSSPVERMRINSAGASLFFSSSDGLRSAVSAAAGTSTALFWGRHSATSTSNGTDSIFVWSNGNVVNTNNSYGSISDIKLKENIVDANSQWGDLKALQVRNYNFKEGQTHTQIGLIAQEAELISPGLVSESPDRDAEGNDLGTVTKSVNYSVLYMKAVKALQEAMERIETLEAKVAALEAV